VTTLETFRGTVYPWQCDHVGHMNVMWYVGRFDEGTWNLMAALGVTPAYLREAGRGMAALSQKIAYKRELHAGDVIVVRSTMLEVRDKTVRFVHEMRNAVTDEVAAVCELVGVHMDTAARKSCPFPADLRHRAEALIGAYDLEGLWR
jgi:acyl-CoA thioester hydrolase